MTTRITDERLAELIDYHHDFNHELTSALRELRVLRRAIGGDAYEWKLDPINECEYGTPAIEYETDLELAIMNAERELEDQQ